MVLTEVLCEGSGSLYWISQYLKFRYRHEAGSDAQMVSDDTRGASETLQPDGRTAGLVQGEDGGGSRYVGGEQSRFVGKVHEGTVPASTASR